MPKPPVKSVLMRVRVYPNEFAAWKRRARADALTLSTWVRDSLNMRFDEPPSALTLSTWGRDSLNARLDEAPSRKKRTP